MPWLHLTNVERIARGYKPVGPRPRDPSHTPRPRPHRETEPVQERFSQQITELVSRANATMERWKLGER